MDDFDIDNNSDDFFSTPSYSNAPTPDVAELNKRRSLIKSLYQEVLGRDADINGLSYYTVHKEITEDDIRKQMVQSTDHRDIVLKSQKYPELEKRVIELEDQVIRLENSNSEKDSLISNLRAVTSNMKTQPNLTGNYAYDMMQSHSEQYAQQQQYQQPQYQQQNQYQQYQQYQPNFQPNSSNQSYQNNKNQQKNFGILGFFKKIIGK